MSCEGYYQCVCENKHVYIINMFDERLYDEGLSIKQIPCIWCKGKNIWYNFVDDTNCDERGHVKIDLFCDDEDKPTVTSDFYNKYIKGKNK